MITIIDDERGEVVVQRGRRPEAVSARASAGFAAASRAWLRAGWDAKYVYGFSWLGRPIIQLPEDLVRIQEVIYQIKPDLIIETGVAHGGSLVFYASLMTAMGHGRVVGIDIEEFRPHNRAAIEAHPLKPRITLIEASSILAETVDRVAAEIGSAKSVMVFLDSNHTRDHVLSELRLYSGFVTPGSCIVAMDGIMEFVVGAPRTCADWAWNNPRRAALDFVAENPDFAIVEPSWPFNEGTVNERVTYWPDAFIRRLR